MLGLLGGLVGRGIAGGIGRSMVARPRGLVGGLVGGLGRQRGGLLGGGGNSRFGGLLGGLLEGQSRSQSGGGGSSSGRRQPEQREEEQPPPTQQGQAVQPLPPEPQSAPPAAQPKPFVEQADQPIRETNQQQQVAAQQPVKPGEPAPVEKQEPPTAGLLDEAPPVPDAKPTSTSEPTPEPQPVVNQTDAPAPVARPEDEQFGETPMLAASGISDRIGEAPPRRDFPMEDPNPSQPVQLSQAKHTGNSPGFHYQTAGSFTAFSPSYSYRRR